MSVTGRLWRRAPLWRTALITAVACTALAAMFPPPLVLPPALNARLQTALAAVLGPHRVPPAGHADQPGISPQADAGRFAPATSATRDYDTLYDPPLGDGRSGVIPIGGRLLPLPSGSWQQIMLAQSGATSALQVSMLARIVDKRLTGVLLIVSPSQLGQTPGPVETPPGCLASDAIARQIERVVRGQNPMAHRCWTLTAADMTGETMRRNALLQRGLTRFASLGVQVPRHMLAVCFVNTDENGGLIATLFVPDEAESPTLPRRLEGWARQFDASVAAGFAGTLKPGDLTPAIARDPA